uniref:Uncharacterized protein n=1 Tax=Schizaphis graminum TaxID=13262 RepID=A0A2S2P6P8_SCHGA
MINCLKRRYQPLLAAAAPRVRAFYDLPERRSIVECRTTVGYRRRHYDQSRIERAWYTATRRQNCRFDEITDLSSSSSPTTTDCSSNTHRNDCGTVIVPCDSRAMRPAGRPASLWPPPTNDARATVHVRACALERVCIILCLYLPMCAVHVSSRVRASIHYYI